jgi:hypothetical protein
MEAVPKWDAGWDRTMTTTAERRKLHSAINTVTPDQVDAIVRKTHPLVRSNRVDQIAKAVIAGAQRQVSPRKTPQ